MKIYKLFLFIFILSLVGCGKDANTQEQDIKTTQATQEQTINEQASDEQTVDVQEEKQTPVSGGELILSMRMPKTFNPLINQDVTVDNILKLIFEPLFTITEDTLKPVPNLASGYSLSEDGKTVYIDMKQDIYWQDGKSITASDVIFSLDTIKKNPDSIYAKALDKVSSYSSNGQRVVINYKEPYSFFAYNLCFPIIPKHYYQNIAKEDEYGIDIKEPLGSGSYKFSSYRLANELILQKTSNFKGTPYIDTIKVIITPDYQTDLYAFEKNIINAINIDFSNWGDLSYKREKLTTGINSNNFEYLGFNFDKPIFKNGFLRKAIAYAIPKDEILKNIYLNNGVKAISPINPKSYLAYKELETYEYSVEDAIEVLGKANLTKDVLNFSILVNKENKERIEMAMLIQKRLSQIGLNITVVKKPFEEYKKDLEEGNFDMFLGGIDFGIIPNLQSFLTSTGTGEGGINYQNFKDEHMDELIENMYKATSEESFIQQAISMQKYFVEQLPVVGIVFKNQMLLTDYTIKGDKQPNIYNQFNNIEKWYIEQEVDND